MNDEFQKKLEESSKVNCKIMNIEEVEYSSRLIHIRTSLCSFS